MGGRRFEWVLVPVCLAAGVFFFTSLDDLWPLVDADLAVPGDSLRSRAGALLESMGHDLAGHRSAIRLYVDTPALDYLERHLGRGGTQARVRDGLPLIHYRVLYKKQGEAITYAVRLHPSGSVTGWAKRIHEDYPGARVPIERARELARWAMVEGLGLAPDDLEEIAASTSERIGHREHRFELERTISREPVLRERVTVTVAGDEVVGALRHLLVPEPALRAQRAREAPGVALETLGFVLVAVAAAAAFFVFLSGMREGTVRLRRAAVWPALVFACLMGTYALQTASLFGFWEPLWPRWVSDFRYLAARATGEAWLLLLLFALIAAGNALDARIGGGRGATLASLGRGRLFDAGVARASGRGFLVGLLCGGVMALGVFALARLAGGTTALQPRGFFFYTLNSASPAAASLLFFFGVALAEELGYRYFGGSWLLSLTRRRWLAVLLPAVMYGLTHTRMDFLPPAEPFWARALVLTLVGCVWGWAFLRYDALTVVLSHFTADLFIFNWPRLASGEPGPILVSVLTICVPLLPAIGRPVLRMVGLVARE
jgi:hypothetical protein